MPQEKLGSNQHLRDLRQVIERLMRDGTAIADLDNSIHDLFPVGINEIEGEALRNWVVREGSVRSIEVGLGYGISTLFICEGLLINGNAEAHHMAVDPFQKTRFKNCALQFLAEAGVDSLVEHLPRESQIALPEFVAGGRTFDFAFVDGSHLFDRVFLDLVYLGRLIRPSGIVFVDDYQLASVSRAVSFCLNNLGWLTEETSPSDNEHQWSVLRLPVEPVQRSFSHFVDF